MSRKLLSLGALAAAFTLVLGTTEVQARHCHNQCSSRSCCQSGNYNRSIFSIFNRCNNGYQQQVNYRCQQPVNNACQVRVQQSCQPAQYIRSNARCNQQSACGVVQTACQNVQAGYAIPEIQTNSPAPAPAPPLDNAPPPAPGPSSAPDPAPAPTPAPGR